MSNIKKIKWSTFNDDTQMHCTHCSLHILEIFVHHNQLKLKKKKTWFYVNATANATKRETWCEILTKKNPFKKNIFRNAVDVAHLQISISIQLSNIRPPFCCCPASTHNYQTMIQHIQAKNLTNLFEIKSIWKCRCCVVWTLDETQNLWTSIATQKTQIF